VTDVREVNLSKPYKAHGEEIQKLRLHRPLTRQLRRASDGAKGEMDTLCRLLSECGGVPTSTIDDLELVDLMAAIEKLAELLPEQLKPSADLVGKAKPAE
jgi:hypothetical protein